MNDETQVIQPAEKSVKKRGRRSSVCVRSGGTASPQIVDCPLSDTVDGDTTHERKSGIDKKKLLKDQIIAYHGELEAEARQWKELYKKEHAAKKDNVKNATSELSSSLYNGVISRKPRFILDSLLSEHKKTKNAEAREMKREMDEMAAEIAKLEVENARKRAVNQRNHDLLTCESIEELKAEQAMWEDMAARARQERDQTLSIMSAFGITI